jgi:hypothetical protein
MRNCLLAVLLLILTGCGKKAPDIVGTWTSGLGGALTTYHFRKDGTFNLETLFDGYRAQVEGKYSFEGGQMHLDPSSVNVEGAGPRIDEIRASLNQPSRLYYRMNGPHSFQMGAQQPPLILSRMSKDP